MAAAERIKASRQTVAVIQARMTSTRLPGKVLANIKGKSLLEHMIVRIRPARLIDQIVVATTINATDNPVVELCTGLGVTVFRGDENDVLARFRAAAERAGADAVVRLTADCPMIDPQVIDKAIARFHQGDVDYVSNCSCRTYPDGLDVEVFSFVALARADAEAVDPWLREHVAPYLRGGFSDKPNGGFRTADITHEADFSHLRWTVDTPEDLDLIRKYFAALPDGFSWQQALALATKHHELLSVSNRYAKA